jgi:hypothetical protein
VGGGVQLDPLGTAATNRPVVPFVVCKSATAFYLVVVTTCKWFTRRKEGGLLSAEIWCSGYFGLRVTKERKDVVSWSNKEPHGKIKDNQVRGTFRTRGTYKKCEYVKF